MNSLTETFIKGSDNAISLTLTEDEEAVEGAWDSISIHIGDPSLVVITRTNDGDGVTFSVVTGVLTIKPGELTEDISALVNGRLYRVHIVVVSASNPDGVDFGADDSSTRLHFLIDERPEAPT